MQRESDDWLLVTNRMKRTERTERERENAKAEWRQSEKAVRVRERRRTK